MDNRQDKKVFIKRRSPRRKSCFFKANKITVINYHDLPLLRRFVTDRGKIVPKRNSGVSAKFQRKLAIAVKRARFMGLLPFCVE